MSGPSPSTGPAAPGPPQPSFASIPLPPGLTLDQYLVAQGEVGTCFVVVVVVVVAMGVVHIEVRPLICAFFQSR